VLELDPDAGPDRRQREQADWLPPNGAQGIAQPLVPSPYTSGTLALIRIVIRGSWMSVTTPRYLPKNWVTGSPPG
jgi:hypothetical protein